MVWIGPEILTNKTQDEGEMNLLFRVKKWFTVMLGLVALAGCASSPMQDAESIESGADNVDVVAADQVVDESAEEAEPAEPKARPGPEDYPVESFEDDELYELLVAEVAGYRSDYDLALEKYLRVAETSRDPGVAARATRLGAYMKKDEQALQAALIWADVEPDHIDAHRHATDLLLRAGRLDEAIAHMEAVKNLGGLAKFDVFAYRATTMSDDQRKKLLVALHEMLQRHPGDEELMFSKAVLLERDRQFEEALVLADELLLTSENVNVIVLKMTLLRSLGKTDESLAYLRSQVELLPENKRLRFLLARTLFEREDLSGARAEYEVILQQSPNDGDVLFALALIALEFNDDEQAQKYFEKMVRWNQRVGEAHYYLGGIAERRSDFETAINEYRQAGDGYEFIPAMARIAALLADDERWEEAREHLARVRALRPNHRQQLIMIEAQLMADRDLFDESMIFLDEVISEEPDNIDLLYFRAMTGQRFDRLDILERDLRLIIDLEPENADALNALGYTLTDQTDRHEEALVLIEKALAIKPDEAAFIDSMGWVQYRLHNYDEAVVHLRRALELFQNDEVAAHLGEVLWVIGEKAEANQVWDKALQLAPESEILKNVILKFREDQATGQE